MILFPISESSLGSITVLAIGPDYASKIDSITGPKGTHPLKLL